MNRFRVVLTQHAVNDLKKILKDLSEQIHRDLETLQTNPLPPAPQVKRLKGFRPPIYRLRSGDFRVLYHLRGPAVTILRVIDRKLLERIIKRLSL